MSPSKHSRRTSMTIPTLLQQLQNTVPPCAQSCLSAYLSQEFNVAVRCPDGDLSCVCGSYSFHGFTLGELALTCLHIGNCRPETVGTQQEQTAFGICSSQRSAVEPTNTVISPPATTPVDSTSTTPTRARTTARPTTAASTASGSPSRLASNSSSPSSSATASSPTQGPQGLTSEQAIGVSIGAVGFVVLAIAFAYILVCVRRRKSKHVEPRNANDFTYDKSFHKSWFNFPACKDNHDEPLSEKRQTQWPSPHVHPSYDYRTREKAVGARTSSSRESRRSSNSNRTVSRLLPEMPSLVQQRPERQSIGPVILQTPATVFEEDRFSVAPARPIPSLPKNPRQPQYAHEFTRTPQAVPQPSLSLTIPQQGACSEAIEAIENFPLPQDRASNPFYQCSKSATSNNSFLNYYEGADSGSPEDFYPYTPMDEHMQIRRPAPAAIIITRPTYPPVAVRTSMTSDTSRRTSFESTDPDELTPPDEADEDDKRLTPVAESPIASIRYPKIPRGSNQAVPRSPPQMQYNSGDHRRRAPSVAQHGHQNPTTPGNRMIQTHTPSLSGSTLVAKRLGDHAAQSLERGLRITNGTPPRKRSQRAREIGDVARNESPANWPLPPQEPLKSPLWEPKLTPRRLGGDLYLSVSVATPQHAHFPEQR